MSDCECCGAANEEERIARIEALRERQHEMLLKRGWYAHIIESGDPSTPSGFNYHTHGFEKTADHLDFQIVFPLIIPETCHAIAEELYKEITQHGKRYEEGDRAKGIIHGFEVTFIKVRECDRDVLRVILPNAEGCLTVGELSESENPAYSLQWTTTI